MTDAVASKPALTQSDLAIFTGSSTWTRHPLNPNILYTDGPAFFAERAGAYWFLDILATEPAILKQMQAGMAVIKLYVADSKARIAVEDGDGQETYSRSIDYTDAPAGTWVFWMVDNTILLPSEY